MQVEKVMGMFMALMIAGLLPLGACESTKGSVVQDEGGIQGSPETIAIWAGAAPGSEDWTRAEIQHELGLGEHPNLIVRNVTKPTLSIYLPQPHNATGAGVVIAPGGGWLMLSINSEGHDVARWLSERGIAAFVLKYRLGETPDTAEGFRDWQARGKISAAIAKASEEVGPLSVSDGEQAMRVVRSNAQAWGVDPDRIGFMGFSAGGFVSTGVMLNDDPEVMPAFVAPIYGGSVPDDAPLSDESPPVFVAVSSDDDLILPSTLEMLETLRSKGVPHEAHIYARGGHGYGLNRQGGASDYWIDQFYWWLADIGVLDSGQ